MSVWLRQSTATEIPMGPFLDDTDGKTAETALSILQANIRLKKVGAAWAQKNAAQTLSHEENGWYEVALDVTDTNTLGPLMVAIHVAGALPVWREFEVKPQAVFDALCSGTPILPVNVTQVEGVDASDQIRDAVFNGVVENSKTFVQVVRGMVAALFGKANGLDSTTANYRDNADTKNRIVATVDQYGNRSAVASDLT